MPFNRVEPDARALIAYIVSRARGRDITLNRTKLVKLLYLIDVEREQSRRQLLTGFEWVFYNYGPYAFELIDTLEGMEGTDIVVTPFERGRYYRAAPGAPDGDEWPAATKMMVDHIVDEFGGMDLNELLDHVYFHTGPMIDARRGEQLDMSRARDYRERHYPALKPPSPTAELGDSFAAWRERNSKRTQSVELDPPVEFFTDDGDDRADVDVHGKLHVPEDTWI